MTLEQRVAALFEDSIRAKRETQPAAAARLVAAGRAMAGCLRANGKILTCGNGGSAGDAQHFAAELINRFERERSALAGLALSTDTSTLTAIANDYDYAEIFARQVQGLGRPGDLLLAISTSGHSANVVRAIETARQCGMRVIALTGGDGGRITREMASRDIELRAKHTATARVQEVHLLFLHCLCDVIDELLFAEPSPAPD